MPRRLDLRQPDREDGEPVENRPASAHPLLALQASAGNRAVTAMVSRLAEPPGQARLKRTIAIQFASALEAARIHRGLQAPPDADGKVTVALGPEGPTQLTPQEAEDLKPAARARKEAIFSRFAEQRAPLFDAMRAATEDDARRAAIVALRDFDSGQLPTLWQVQEILGGWDIDDPTARDAVLAAIQLEAATDAEGELHNDRDEVQRRVTRRAGMALHHDWCGFFAMEHYQRARMDEDFKWAFHHVDNVEDFFAYRDRTGRSLKRVPKWLWDGNAWRDVREYHEERGALRQWLSGPDLWQGGDLDIRPGDVVLLDWEMEGRANHIVKASSYDAATSTLFTIGGNDTGLVADPTASYAGPRAGTPARERHDRAEAAMGEELRPGRPWSGTASGAVGVGVHDVAAAPGRRRSVLHGIGRPSIVDFEDHVYDHGRGNLRRPPPPLSR